MSEKAAERDLEGTWRDQDAVARGLVPPQPHSAPCVRPGAQVQPRGEYLLKRPIDLAAAAMGIIVTAPLWAMVAAAIKLEDRGPVLYPQERWGRGGSKFNALKFRSMVVNGDETHGRSQARRGDPRITRVGRFMRKSALDELPQLINILRGDMSLVGPRALPVNEPQTNDQDSHLPDDQIPGFAARCQVRPGLTGIAQFYAPRDIARRHKFRYDALYVRRQSLGLDLRLILRSIWISLTAGWERYHHTVDSRRRGRRAAQ